MSPLATQVLAWLKKDADPLGKVRSDVNTVGSEIGAAPGDVHEALVQLVQIGRVDDPYFDGNGSFIVTLR
jgi:hypothetical protein